MLDRVLGCVGGLLAEPGWRRLLVVAHGGVNRVLLAHALGSGLAGFAALEDSNSDPVGPLPEKKGADGARDSGSGLPAHRIAGTRGHRARSVLRCGGRAARAAVPFAAQGGTATTLGGARDAEVRGTGARSGVVGSGPVFRAGIDAARVGARR